MTPPPARCPQTSPNPRDHGTEGAYRRGCRCPAAREQNRLRQKRRREQRHQPLLVPTVGARRRLRALAAIGWTGKHVAADAGVSHNTVRDVIVEGRKTYIHRDTHQAIADTYRRLTAQPGPSQLCRKVAATKGWPGPMAWDRIDDPDELPDLRRSVVGGLRSGSEHLDDVARLTRAGKSARAIAVELRISRRSVERLRGRLAAERDDQAGAA